MEEGQNAKRRLLGNVLHLSRPEREKEGGDKDAEWLVDGGEGYSNSGKGFQYRERLKAAMLPSLPFLSPDEILCLKKNYFYSL